MKIALIAMSGIRVVDPELLEIGLTLPGVLERGKVIASLPSLGLLTIAGMTPAEHDIQYFEVTELEDVESLPSLAQFDLVAISSLTPQIFEAYALANRIRMLGGKTKVVMGGLHVTSLPDEAQQHCDAVIVGEGESFWPEVVEDVSKGNLKPVYQDAKRSFNLSQSPMPRFELLDRDRYNRITLQTSRGCPLKCEFCAGSILLTSKYKQKPASRVLAELDRIRELWDRPFIEFADDNSFSNRRYWQELLPQLAKRRLRWFAETDISICQDSQLLTAMRRAGCVEVLIGLESPDREGLKGVELKSDWKFRHFDDCLQGVKNIQQHGIAVNGCFVVGLDHQRDDIFERIEMTAKEMELFDVQVTVQTPFPGTPLYARLLAEGRILEPGEWNKCTLFDVNFQPIKMSAERLRSGFHDLVRRLYCPEASQWRRENFQQKYYRPLWEGSQAGE